VFDPQQKASGETTKKYFHYVTISEKFTDYWWSTMKRFNYHVPIDISKRGLQGNLLKKDTLHCM
jgi:hypothetical protein